MLAHLEARAQPKFGDWGDVGAQNLLDMVCAWAGGQYEHFEFNTNCDCNTSNPLTLNAAACPSRCFRRPMESGCPHLIVNAFLVSLSTWPLSEDNTEVGIFLDVIEHEGIRAFFYYAQHIDGQIKHLFEISFVAPLKNGDDLIFKIIVEINKIRRDQIDPDNLDGRIDSHIRVGALRSLATFMDLKIYVTRLGASERRPLINAEICNAIGSMGASVMTVTLLAFTLDSTAPAAPVIELMTAITGASVTDGITAAGTVTVSGTVEANSTVRLYNAGTLAGTVTADASGAWSVANVALILGSNALTATATDLAGNVSMAGSFTATRLGVITVQKLAASVAPGSVLHAGDTIAFTLPPSAAVQVTPASGGGVPALTLNDGGMARYTGQDASGNLLFSYTVGAADATADLKVTGLVLNGASIDNAGTTAFLPPTAYATGAGRGASRSAT